MTTQELLQKVRRIEIKTRGLSSHLFSGEYHSAFKGRGMSFSEVRAYQYGDDVRTIEWNVTARTGIPHVKIFEEERELTVMLLVDVSASAFFGSRSFKQTLITEICAVLSFSAIQNNDKVGVIFFSDQVEKFLPPKKGRQHILRIIRELLDFHPTGKATDVGLALEFFNNLVKKRSICFVLSDFLAPNFIRPLQIAARRHDLIGLHVFDPLETSLPDVGLVHCLDPETGRIQWVDSSSKVLRDVYAHTAQHHVDGLRSTFGRAGADFVSISTEANYVKELLGFFKKRI